MEEIDSSPTAPSSPNRKRAAPGEDTPGKKPLNLKGTQFVMPTPPDTEESSNTSPMSSNEKEGSPAPSISTMTSVEIVGSNETETTQTATTHMQSGSGVKPPPAKRRKLTPTEKLEQAREKEAKAKEKEELKAKKEEEKARKEEEKRAKEDDKRAKDEEKRRKAEEREEKKREKELEEQRKQDQKLKKERSQMRLGAFFQGKPGTPAKSPVPDAGSARRKSLSLEPFEAVKDQIRPSASPSKTAASEPAVEEVVVEKPKPTVPDYNKYFLPFELPQHTTIAACYSIPNPDDYAYWQGEFDRDVHNPSMQEKADLGLVEPTAVVDHMFQSGSSTSRGIRLPSIRKLIDQMQGTSKEPIDLTGDGNQPAVHALQNVSRRHVQFEEDVRPAYFGTYSKVISPRTTRRLMINPFTRARPDTDYDYDSEAEWEEPEEGEDIIGDEEDEAESLGDADEMDGFLDDEEDALKSKRKMITGDLQAVSTGLCWENSSSVVVQSIEGEDGTSTETKGTPKEMSGMRIGFLLPQFRGQTIDPFSSVYWAHEMAPPGVPVPEATFLKAHSAFRPPLQEKHSNEQLKQQSLIGAAEGEKGPITSAAAAQSEKRGPKVKPKTLSKEDLEEFKEAVVGSPLGKVELSKGLKARFPKVTMEAIKATLDSHFAYMGVKGDKKWKFVGEA